VCVLPSRRRVFPGVERQSEAETAVESDKDRVNGVQSWIASTPRDTIPAWMTEINSSARQHGATAKGWRQRRFREREDRSPGGVRPIRLSASRGE